MGVFGAPARGPGTSFERRQAITAAWRALPSASCAARQNLQGLRAGFLPSGMSPRLRSASETTVFQCKQIQWNPQKVPPRGAGSGNSRARIGKSRSLDENSHPWVDPIFGGRHSRLSFTGCCAGLTFPILWLEAAPSLPIRKGGGRSPPTS